MRDLWRGNANAWECDEMGHMNVRPYAEKAGEALSHLLSDLGLANAEQPAAASLLRVTELHARWLAEAHAGAPLDAVGGVTALGACELETAVVIRHALDARPAAGFLTRMERLSPSTFKPFGWSKRITAAAKAAIIAPPEAAAPRSIDRAPTSGDASLARANALDLLEIGRGVFRLSDADATGQVRASTFIGRASDAAARLFLDAIDNPAQSGIGVALMEARLLFLRTPRAGDRFVMRSGFTECTPKLARLVHWFLDPETGEAWATMQGASLFFDLNARKAAPLSAERLKRLKENERPAITP